MSEIKRLVDVIVTILHGRKGKKDISPIDIATEAMEAIPTTHKPGDLCYLAAHLEFRQLARQVLRRNAGDLENLEDDQGPAQQPLFEEFQERYPIFRPKGEEPVYRLFEHLTDADIAYNVARLRAEGGAKLEHAKRLEAWGLERRKSA